MKNKILPLITFHRETFNVDYGQCSIHQMRKKNIFWVWCCCRYAAYLKKPSSHAGVPMNFDEIQSLSFVCQTQFHICKGYVLFFSSIDDVDDIDVLPTNIFDSDRFPFQSPGSMFLCVWHRIKFSLSVVLLSQLFAQKIHRISFYSIIASIDFVYSP